jgi:hypothetical protein
MLCLFCGDRERMCTVVQLYLYKYKYQYHRSCLPVTIIIVMIDWWIAHHLFLPCLSLCQQTKAIKQSSKQQYQASKQAFKKQANALIFIPSPTKSLYKLLLLKALSVSH